MAADDNTRRANRAALTNFAVTVAIPALFIVLLWWQGSQMQNNGVRVYSNGDPGVGFAISVALLAVLFSSPVAAFVAWRTHVHALQRLTDGASGWRGVAEAAACGFGTALLVLLPGLLTNPLAAPPYAIFYGGVATLVGALLGLILRVAALVALGFSA